jgi:hypothetical protein
VLFAHAADPAVRFNSHNLYFDISNVLIEFF